MMYDCHVNTPLCSTGNKLANNSGIRSLSLRQDARASLLTKRRHMAALPTILNFRCLDIA
jgi:hypothetical protein